MTGSVKRGAGRSIRATRTGARSAGTKRVPRKSPAVARALSVWSKTRTARATIPIQSPSSLIAYVIASRLKAGRRSGSRRRGLLIGQAWSYLVSAQVSLQLHNFHASCDTTAASYSRDLACGAQLDASGLESKEGNIEWASVTSSSRHER